ncbi:glycyl-tRNA synthetase [Cryptosporidium andersoni]|uniref:Glycyl-tRNA synthetase n=1 Tax=Cryptosporidium andersoni TaxID=117008 RepID=A0A1J4MWA4_9CRYT|nr:glycyl-tRNA synthetase [Cryptosporidium andersoni]
MSYDKEQEPILNYRGNLENLLRRRFFVIPSFEIYGGVAGLFDYGPPGCALKAEIEGLWRKHFILHEDMLEISATCLTPYSTLKASGHVDRFTDFMITDTKTNDYYRADKVLEEYAANRLSKNSNNPPKNEAERSELELIIIQAGSYNSDEIRRCLDKYSILAPSGAEWSNPYPFNLMFKTKIGPKQSEDDDKCNTGFLRPETAQGIFVNFRRLLDYNGKKLPFAAAQIGLGFRNEIAPRNGLLRVREFQMAEIEHFVHPERKNHPKFFIVENLCLPLYPRSSQLNNTNIIKNMTLKEAVHGPNKVIDNETLAYFLARSYLFFKSIGINIGGLRFRQHLETEMAHYASDCWDAEILTSYGWIECAGHADRSCYDLIQHSKSAKVDLLASEHYDEPQIKPFVKLLLNRPLIGKTFKQEAPKVIEVLQDIANKCDMSVEEALRREGSYNLNYKYCSDNKKYKWEITREMVNFELTSKRVTEEHFIPAVIEPSFGIGRIIYCVLEHSFRIRSDESLHQINGEKISVNKDIQTSIGEMQRCYLSIPPIIAPIKCSILPISSNIIFNDIVNIIRDECIGIGISCKLDTSSASIGRRYARTDEIGIPFGITVDFQTIKDNTVTLRERDTMKQVRLHSSEVVKIISELSYQKLIWSDVLKMYPLFTQQDE